MARPIEPATLGSVRTIDVDNVPPLVRVAIACELAYRSSWDPYLRPKAYEAAGPIWTNIPQGAPRRLAKWIRRHIRYAKESPGLELLQGPWTTLDVQIGDCDDLSILWASFMLALGLPAEVAGLGRFGHPPQHAIGLDPSSGQLFEFSKDFRYSRVLFRSLRFEAPRGYYWLSWDPLRQTLRTSPGATVPQRAAVEAECRKARQIVAALLGGGCSQQPGACLRTCSRLSLGR